VDAESLAQIERLVTSAAEGLRQEIADARADLRQEIGATRADLRQEIADVRASLQQQIANVSVDLGQKINHTGVAEGLHAHVDRRHAEDREYFDRQFRETRALIQLSYEQLHQRVESLEHRVRTIEQHLGLTV